jgi:hypothetical protein
VVLPTLNVHIFCLLKSIYLVTFWNLFLHPLRVCKLLENKDKLNFYQCRRAEAPCTAHECPKMLLKNVQFENFGRINYLVYVMR